MPPADRDLALLALAKSLFGDNELQVLVQGSPTGRVEDTPADVAIIHLPTGLHAQCGRWPTQQSNQLHALLELRVLLDGHPVD